MAVNDVPQSVWIRVVVQRTVGERARLLRTFDSRVHQRHEDIQNEDVIIQWCERWFQLYTLIRS
jgi:hypothetical protein